MNRVSRIILLVVIIALAGGIIYWGMSQREPVSTEPIKIGWIAPLTTDVSAIGLNAKAATEIAVAEVNAAGGINGRNLEVIYEDGMCSGKEASNAANKLINIDRVSIIIGGDCSGETASFVKTAKENRVIVITPCSSATSLANSGDYFFRLYPADTFQGSYAASYIYNDFSKKKVAILFSQNDWGTGIKDAFVKKYKALGGEIVDIEGMNEADKDFKVQLTKIKEAKPELVYFLAYTEQTILGLRQAAELGLNVPFFGGDPWDDGTVWQKLGKIGEGASFIVPYSPLNADFKAKMKNKIGNDTIIACSPSSYDSIKLIALAMSKVGTDTNKIQDYLHKMQPYTQGVANDNISFDSAGELRSVSYILKQIKDGKIVEGQIIK